MSLQATLKATSTIKFASNKSGRFVKLFVGTIKSNMVSLALFCRSSRKAKAVPVAEEKDQKVDDEKEIDNGLVLLLRSIILCSATTVFQFSITINKNPLLGNNNISIFPFRGSRSDLLAYKFIEKIRQRIEARKKPPPTDSEGDPPKSKKNYFTEMIKVCNIDPEKLLDRPKEELVEDLSQYVKTLKLEEKEVKELEEAGKATMASEQTNNWMVPEESSAWGRRIFNDEEIDGNEEVEVKSKFMQDQEEEEEEEGRFDRTTATCTDRDQLQKLGLWDHVYDSGLIPSIENAKVLKPWLTNKKDLAAELRRLGLKKTDLKLTGPKPIILDTINNPVDRITAKYMDTGSYLRPHDMQFCVERTKFKEEKIVAWFKRFRKECPDGRLTRHHLRALFQKVFPDGNASKITSHVFRIFDSDGNDFLDFKEFLMAIDIANRDTGL